MACDVGDQTVLQQRQCTLSMKIIKTSYSSAPVVFDAIQDTKNLGEIALQIQHFLAIFPSRWLT